MDTKELAYEAGRLPKVKQGKEEVKEMTNDELLYASKYYYSTIDLENNFYYNITE